MRTSRLVVAAIVLLTLSGCVPSGTHAAASPSPSATPVFASEEEALAAAEKAYAEYLRVSDEISAGGGGDANRLKSVAVGNLVQDDLDGYETFRAKSWHTTGSSKIAAFKAQFVDQDASQSSHSALVAYVCEDISQVDVRDASGVSVVSSTRPSVQGFEVDFDLVDSSLFPSNREPWTGSNLCD